MGRKRGGRSAARNANHLKGEEIVHQRQSSSRSPIAKGAAWLLENFERLLVCGFLSLFAVVLILQVFMRYVLRDPLPWPEEFSRYLLIWTAFVGSSLAVKEGRVINIDILPSICRGWALKALTFIMHLGFLAFCVIAIYYSLDFIQRIARSGQVSPAMGVPMWWVYSAAPIGLGFSALRTLEAIFSRDSKEKSKFVDAS